MPATAVHPKCGTRFPSNDSTGHCAKCCRTFYGLTAFDQHQTAVDGAVTCTDPDTETGKPWWLDEDGRWHYGERMTEQAKQAMRRNR